MIRIIKKNERPHAMRIDFENHGNQFGNVFLDREVGAFITPMNRSVPTFGNRNVKVVFQD